MSTARCYRRIQGIVLLAAAARPAYAEEVAPAAPAVAPPPALAEPGEPALKSPASPLPPPPPPPPRQTMRPAAGAAAPEPSTRLPPPPPKREHLHDGFYFRFSGGPVYARTEVETDRSSQPDASVRAMGVSFEFWVGGTLRPGIVIGGLLMAMGGDSDDGVVGDTKGAVASFSSSQIGVFLDAYPNPAEGYHFGGLLAAATSALETDAEAGLAATKFEGGGVGVAVFAGLDAWIAKQWSAGVQLRLGGSLTRDEATIDGIDTTKQGTTYAASVLGTLLCH